MFLSITRYHIKGTEVEETTLTFGTSEEIYTYINAQPHASDGASGGYDEADMLIVFSNQGDTYIYSFPNEQILAEVVLRFGDRLENSCTPLNAADFIDIGEKSLTLE